MDELDLTATQSDAPAGHASGRELVAGAKIGRYVVLDLLGERAMGQVYTSYDVDLDRKVAIKVIRANLVSTRVRERTLREAKALAQLSHPHVVQVYEVGAHGNQIFFAMEHVDGTNLRQVPSESVQVYSHGTAVGGSSPPQLQFSSGKAGPPYCQPR